MVQFYGKRHKPVSGVRKSHYTIYQLKPPHINNETSLENEPLAGVFAHAGRYGGCGFMIFILGLALHLCPR